MWSLEAHSSLSAKRCGPGSPQKKMGLSITKSLAQALTTQSEPDMIGRVWVIVSPETLEECLEEPHPKEGRHMNKGYEYQVLFYERQ